MDVMMMPPAGEATGTGPAGAGANGTGAGASAGWQAGFAAVFAGFLARLTAENGECLGAPGEAAEGMWTGFGADPGALLVPPPECGEALPEGQMPAGAPGTATEPGVVSPMLDEGVAGPAGVAAGAEMTPTAGQTGGRTAPGPAAAQMQLPVPGAAGGDGTPGPGQAQTQTGQAAVQTGQAVVQSQAQMQMAAPGAAGGDGTPGPGQAQTQTGQAAAQSQAQMQMAAPGAAGGDGTPGPGQAQTQTGQAAVQSQAQMQMAAPGAADGDGTPGPGQAQAQTGQAAAQTQIPTLVWPQTRDQAETRPATVAPAVAEETTTPAARPSPTPAPAVEPRRPMPFNAAMPEAPPDKGDRPVFGEGPREETAPPSGTAVTRADTPPVFPTGTEVREIAAAEPRSPAPAPVQAVEETIARQVIYRVLGELEQLRGQTGKVVRMELQLHPPELGRVIVRLVWQTGGLEARFLAGDQTVRGAIEQALPQLREALGRQEVNLLDVSADLARDNDGEPMRRGPRGSRLIRYTVATEDAEKAVRPPEKTTAWVINRLA